MEIHNLSAHSNLPFKMALKPIPKKAYKIAGNSLSKAEPVLKDLAKAQGVDIEVIPKKGLLTKIQGITFFVTEKGRSYGDWVNISKDPKGYLPQHANRYITVKTFSPSNVIDAARKAITHLREGSGALLSRATASVFPADSALLVKLGEKLFKS